MLLIISLVFEDRVVGCMSLDRGGLVANTVALERTEGEISCPAGQAVAAGERPWCERAKEKR
jgi:hypothetical protein